MKECTRPSQNPNKSSYEDSYSNNSVSNNTSDNSNDCSYTNNSSNNTCESSSSSSSSSYDRFDTGNYSSKSSSNDDDSFTYSPFDTSNPAYKSKSNDDSYTYGPFDTSNPAYKSKSSSNTSSYNSTYTSSVRQKPESKYANNRISSGSTVYSTKSLLGNDSKIEIRTSSSANCDLVAIVKYHGAIVRNAYIRAGRNHTFYVPNGTYQVFFYAGTGWNPTKPMPRGLKGGFVANESFSKDSPTRLEYKSVVYELIPQLNGNFSTIQSSESEIF